MGKNISGTINYVYAYTYARFTNRTSKYSATFECVRGFVAHQLQEKKTFLLINPRARIHSKLQVKYLISI